MSTLPSTKDATTLDPPIDPSILPVESEDSNASQKKKKKKRRREEEERVEDISEEVVKENKRKKKKRRLEEAAALEESVEASQNNDVQTPEGKKKKRKKKDKGKQPETATPQTDVSLESREAREAAAALLAALVSAATGPSRDDHRTQMLHPVPQYDPALVPPNSSQQISLFPYLPYPYGQPPIGPGNPTPPPPSSTLFPTGANLTFSEMSFGSNEDVLRALQALDVSKITSVLKNIGETAGGAHDDSAMMPPHGLPIPVVPGQMFSPFLQGPPAHYRNLPDQTNADHAHLLATKWLNASKLAQLVKSEGLVYKKGKFSAIEEQQLQDAIENYRVTRGFDQTQIQNLIFPQHEKNRDNVFWSELTSAVPLRPIIAVYHHVRRTHHPLKRQGLWNAEEDAALKKAVIDYGQQWEKISPYVGRMPSDCRDRYRNHIVNRDIRVNGAWTKEEEEKLTRIVIDMTINQGKDIDNEVFWGKVSEIMGGTRGRQQCRIKWTDGLSHKIKAGGHKTRWSQQDAFILVHKLAALDVRDDTEIDWKMLPDSVWNLWSAHALQRRWLTMKRGIKGYEDMTHQEIMDILRLRKAQMPDPPPLSRKRRRIMSAASVAEEAPGSSTGPGTLADGSDSEDSTGEDDDDGDESSSSDSD